MLQNAMLMMNTTSPSNQDDDDVNSGEAFWKQTMLEHVRSKLRLIYAICHKRIGKNKTVDLQVRILVKNTRPNLIDVRVLVSMRFKQSLFCDRGWFREYLTN